MTAAAVVKSVLPGNKVLLKVLRDSSCGDCATCGGCAASGKELTVEAENRIGAKPGDRVRIETSDKNAVLPLLTVFLLPVLLFFAGYALGTAVSGIPALFGAAGALCAVGAALLLNRLYRKKELYTVTGFSEDA